MPVVLSGGLRDEERTLAAFEQTGAAAVMLARGSLGNPWRFERLLGTARHEPTRAEIAEELRWVIDRAEEHLGVERAGRYLRKFYPWYADDDGAHEARPAAARHCPHDGPREGRAGRSGGAANAQIAA